MLQFKEQSNGITFDVKFDDKVNLFTGISGEGKTFLFSVIKGYLDSMGESCAHFSSDIFKLENPHKDDFVNSLKLFCRGKSVIIFDNADLYLTQSLLDYACSIADTVIVSMKLYYKLRFRDFEFYYVDYSGNTLVVRKE